MPAHAYSENAPESLPSSDNEPALDKKEALQLVGGDEDIFREAVTMFVDQIPAYLEKLAQAHSSGDFAGLRTLAHTLKSTAATVGASTLRPLFIALETASVEKNAGTASGLVAQIEKEFTRYREAAAAETCRK